MAVFGDESTQFIWGCSIPTQTKCWFNVCCVFIQIVFPNVTSINLSATIWSYHASGSTNWPQVEKLIWQKCLCTSTIFLSDLRTSTNLIELRLDNSTIGLPHSYEAALNLVHDAHPFTIFQNLNNCNQLTILSYVNYWLQWKRENVVLDKLYLPGQMCSQWLLQSAPLSLRWYVGPLFSREIEAVEERCRLENNSLEWFPISFNPQPLDHNEYFTKYV